MLNSRTLLLMSALTCLSLPAYAVDDAAAKGKMDDSKPMAVHEDWSKLPADIKGEERESFLKKWESMSPEEKQAFHKKRMEERADRRKEWKEKWEKASPEERKAMEAKRQERMDERREAREERRKEMKVKYDNASPEEQAKMKEKWKERREARKERREKMHDHGKHDGMHKGHAPAR